MGEFTEWRFLSIQWCRRESKVSFTEAVGAFFYSCDIISVALLF